MTTEIDATSKEYIGFPVTELTGINPASDAVELTLTVNRSSQGAVWVAGEWKTIGGKLWAVILVGPGSTYGAVTRGRYWLKVRITDSPEIPVKTSPNQLTFY